MLSARTLAWVALLLLAAPALPAAEPDPPVTVQQDERFFTLSNGFLTAQVTKTTGDAPLSCRKAPVPALLQLRVKMAQRGELAGEFGATGCLHPAPRRKVASPEQVRGGNHRRSHGPVLVGSLRPRQLSVHPKIEAHWPYVTTRGSALRPLPADPRSGTVFAKRGMPGNATPVQDPGSPRCTAWGGPRQTARKPPAC